MMVLTKQWRNSQREQPPPPPPPHFKRFLKLGAAANYDRKHRAKSAVGCGVKASETTTMRLESLCGSVMAYVMVAVVVVVVAVAAWVTGEAHL